ncbi:MAG: patatin-like phospholipase family protein [bacterium]
MNKKPRIALALGGGGARGCGHIGALKVLQRERIPIDFITGSSIGAIIGSIYATSGDAARVEERFRQFLESEEYKKSGLDLFKRQEPAENFFGQVATHIKQRVVVNLAQSKLSLVGGQRMIRAMEFLIPDGRIESTKIPFYAVASNLLTGEQVVFREGDLRLIVGASASIPGFLPPYKVNGYLLVDGSVVCPVPVLPARDLGADIIIAIDVGQKLNDNPNLDNVISVMFQTQHMTARHFNLLLLEEADVVIRPDVGLVHWSEFKLLNYMIEEGERVTEEAIPKIKQLIKEKTSTWKRLFAKSEDVMKSAAF